VVEAEFRSEEVCVDEKAVEGVMSMRELHDITPP
jgi:hypothetical protein